MLESKGALATWALVREPATGQPIPAHVLADHRATYLDYEGPVSGGRGTVRRWDRGSYQLLERTPTRWVVTIDGQRLCGRVEMGQAQKDGPWEFHYTAR